MISCNYEKYVQINIGTFKQMCNWLNKSPLIVNVINQEHILNYIHVCILGSLNTD